ncbi:hypothetical protein O181_008415 [Austropuccinia psidii MF-1]|uniref:Uncharacterized protein n=1 Tax=Austropuccinia psidii MF-1 TaxID=1389203 RepID=A0A9Q3GIV5_9BASI|nr:hypothetical protein [Austropuccinia psidii MF-1]
MRPNFKIEAGKDSWVEIRAANVNKAMGIQHIIQEAFIADAPFLGGISIGDSGADEPMHSTMNAYNFWSVVVGNTVQNSNAKIHFPSYRVTNGYLKDWANKVAKWQAEKDEE